MNGTDIPPVGFADEQKAEARMPWNAPCLRHYPMGTVTNNSVNVVGDDGSATRAQTGYAS